MIKFVNLLSLFHTPTTFNNQKFKYSFNFIACQIIYFNITTLFLIYQFNFLNLKSINYFILISFINLDFPFLIYHSILIL